MSHIEINVDLQEISQSTSIWRLFPGKNYRWIDVFKERNIVFPDLPGFSLPEDKNFGDTLDIRERIAYSDAVKSWCSAERVRLRKGAVDDQESRPSILMENYFSDSFSDKHNPSLGIVTGLFSKAAKGDVIIVPNTLKSSEILIGEFLANPSDHFSYPLQDRYFEFPVRARNVKWLSFPRHNEFSIDFWQRLRQPNAFSAIPRQYYGEVLDRSYASYALKDEDGFSYSADLKIDTVDFSGTDTLDIYILVQAAQVLAERMARACFEPRSVSLADLIARIPLEEKNRIITSSSIHSPGFLNFKSGSVAAILVVMLMAMATCSNSEIPLDPATIRVVSRNPSISSECLLELEQSVRRSAELLGVDALQDLCERARIASVNAQVRIPASAVSR